MEEIPDDVVFDSFLGQVVSEFSKLLTFMKESHLVCKTPIKHMPTTVSEHPKSKSKAKTSFFDSVKKKTIKRFGKETSPAQQEDKENKENAVIVYSTRKSAKSRPSVKSLFSQEVDELPTAPTTPTNNYFEEELYATRSTSANEKPQDPKKRKRNLFSGSLRKKLKNEL
jgi:hypothetical protein